MNDKDNNWRANFDGRYSALTAGDSATYTGTNPDVHRMSTRIAAPGDLLELGCGEGSALLEFAELGHRCTGIELDPDAAERARDRAAGLARVVTGGAPDALIEFEAMSFD